MKSKIHYSDYLKLNDEDRAAIDYAILSTCRYYFNRGFSVNLSCSMAFSETPYLRTLVNQVIKKDKELQELFKKRIAENRSRKGWHK